MRYISWAAAAIFCVLIAASLQSEEKSHELVTARPKAAVQAVPQEVSLPESPALRVWSRNVKAKKLLANSPERPLIIYSPNRENVAFGDEMIIPVACKDVMVLAKLEKIVKKPATVCVETFDSKKRGQRKSFTFTFAGETSEILMQFRLGQLLRADMLKPRPRTLYHGSSARAAISRAFFY